VTGQADVVAWKFTNLLIVLTERVLTRQAYFAQRLQTVAAVSQIGRFFVICIVHVTYNTKLLSRKSGGD
jgi:hypothetical protein